MDGLNNSACTEQVNPFRIISIFQTTKTLCFRTREVINLFLKIVLPTSLPPVQLLSYMGLFGTFGL